MKVTAMTLPRRSRSASRAPSWVVSVNSGAGPILDRRALPVASWPGALTGHAGAASATSRTKAQMVRRFTLSLQLLLQLVEEPPVGALGDDFLGRALDHPRLVQAERVE